MKNKIDLKSFEWLFFVGVMIVLFFSTQTYFNTANYSRIYRINIVCILLFLIYSLWANHGQLIIYKKRFLSYNLIIIPNLFLFIISLIFYYNDKRITLKSLLEANIQAILVCIMAIVVYNSFRKKAIKGVLIAATVNYSIYVITCIVMYGPLALFQAGRDTKASRLLEVHEVTFVFGLLIIYFLVSNYFIIKSIKKRWILLLLLFFLLGFKRILFAAVILSTINYFSLKKQKKPTIILIESILIIITSMVWIYICSSWDILYYLSNRFGINLSGRNWIYSNFYSYYDFSIKYNGAGIGYVQQMIYKMSTMTLNGHSIGLHNEYMRLFIELGFIPYIIFFVITWLIPIIIIYKKLGYQKSLAYFCLWLLVAVCIATDNLLTYPNFMFVFWLIIITVINETI